MGINAGVIRATVLVDLHSALPHMNRPLNTALLDIPTLNKHLFTWEREVKDAANALSDDAAYLAQQGRVEDAARLGGALKSLRPIESLLGFGVRLDSVLYSLSRASGSPSRRDRAGDRVT